MRKIRMGVLGMIVLIGENLLPLLMLGSAVWLYRGERGGLVRWRRNVFVLALIASATSAVGLLTYAVLWYMIFSGERSVDLFRVYPQGSMLIVGVLAAGLAVSGRRISRVILIANGILTAVLWYIATMATSP